MEAVNAELLNRVLSEAEAFFVISFIIFILAALIACCACISEMNDRSSSNILTVMATIPAPSSTQGSVSV